MKDVKKVKLTDRFTAAPDKLRALKNGANPELLNMWVGLVFARPTFLGDEEHDALTALSQHPFLPKTGLSLAKIPIHALVEVRALERARELGMSLKNIVPGKHGNVRRAALALNAPAEVHNLLDLVGVPDVTLPDFAKAMRQMVDDQCVVSFRYLLEHRPRVMEQAFKSHSPALSLVVKAWSKAWSHEEGLARMTAIVHSITWAGASWERAIDETIDASRSLEEPAWVVPFKSELANWKAAYLSKAWARAEEEEVQQPRRKPRL